MGYFDLGTDLKVSYVSCPVPETNSINVKLIPDDENGGSESYNSHTRKF